MILAILIMKLTEPFKKQTVYVKQQQNTLLIPQFTNISTFQHDPQSTPYMMAIGLDVSSCAQSVINITANYVTYYNNTQSNPNFISKPINLVNCTAQHFVHLPQLLASNGTGYQSWQCLPLNQTYELGGNYLFSQTYSYIIFQFTCTNSCPIDYCGIGHIFQLSSQTNTSSKQPFQYFLKHQSIDIGQFSYNQYAIRLTQNVVNTDQSLIPFPNENTVKGYSVQNMEKRSHTRRDVQQSSVIWIERSATTRIIDRSYLTLIDVLSYVGGIFPSLFGIFFFMNAFGMYFFQMTFAYQHFKCKQTRYNHFGQFLKQSIYKTVSGFGLAKNWQIAKIQCEINDLINKMLDINYLYKRIQFLQSAISVLLSENQLKGVYLSQVTINKAKVHYHNHKIRDRVVTLLDRKAKIRKKQLEKDDDSMSNDLKLSRPIKTEVSLPNVDEFQTKGNQIELFPMEESVSSPKRKKIQIKSKLESQKKYSKTKNTMERIRERNRLYLQRQSSMIEPLDEMELNEYQLEQQFQHDLKSLFREARKKKGDPVSKRIVQNIDEWLKSELQIVIDQFEEENPRFQFSLRDIDGDYTYLSKRKHN